MTTRRGILLFLVMLFMAACAPTSAVPTPTSTVQPLVVVWVEQGNLLIWQTDSTQPRRIASGGVVQPYLAPDGKHVVFTRGPQYREETLWVVDSAGTAEQQLVGAGDVRPVQGGKLLIGQVAWFDSSVLYFNTLLQTDTAVNAQNDLYRANVRTREVALILPRSQGGQFTFSPDRQHIAVVYPGTYGRQDGRIKVIDPLGAHDAVNLLFFVGVSTGSNYSFYPTPYWEPDNAHVLAAIPDKDSVYADNTKPVELWRLPIDAPRNREKIGTVPASFFGQPQWSDDARILIYIQRQGDPTSNQFALNIAETNGANPVLYASGQAGSFEPPRWIPGTNRFTFQRSEAAGSAATTWLGAPGIAPQPLLNGKEAVSDSHFVAADWVVFATPPTDSGFQLRYAAPNADSSSLIAAVNATVPAFDAVSMAP